MGAFYRFGLRGDRERAKDAVSEQTEAALGTDLQYSWMLAQCYALIEENDRAIHWLQNAVERGFVNYRKLEFRMDAAFFNEKILKRLERSRCEFAIKAPFWPWLGRGARRRAQAMAPSPGISPSGL